MRLSRLFLPLLFIMSLLSAQQVGAAHTLGHALAEQSQQDKHAPHSPACEKCENYAQLGNALGVAAFDLDPPALPAAPLLHRSANFSSAPAPTAVARGPPGLLRIA